MANNPSLCKLWTCVKALLLLSHGQASVERGFSVKKQVEIDNLSEDTFVAKRLVCDRKSLAGPLLTETTEVMQDAMRQQLLGKDCTLIEDGWSNIHNDPVSGMCLHVENEAFFLEAVDTTSNKKTAEYCKSLVQKAITSAQEKYGCHVRNIVTDNAKSMEKMRRLLKEEDEDLIVYGCSSHMLNLLGQSVTQSAIIKHIVDIQKYFRNHHVPSLF